MTEDTRVRYWNSKVTWQEVLIIRGLAAWGWSKVALAANWGLTTGAIYAIVRGDAWPWLPGHSGQASPSARARYRARLLQVLRRFWQQRARQQARLRRALLQTLTRLLRERSRLAARRRRHPPPQPLRVTEIYSWSWNCLHDPTSVMCRRHVALALAKFGGPDELSGGAAS